MEQDLLARGLVLPVMETFVSLQGEGFHTGTPAFFIRIGGCDVGCHWCDVKESWNPELFPPVPADEVTARAPAHIDTVVITGGEPLLYRLGPLTEALHRAGKKIHLETSGSEPLSGAFDWICLSPKRTALPQAAFYAVADELKVIVAGRSDLDFALEQADKVPAGTRLYLQPEWSRREEVVPFMVDFIMAHPRWRLSLQTHKYIGLP